MMWEDERKLLEPAVWGTDHPIPKGFDNEEGFNVIWLIPEKVMK